MYSQWYHRVVAFQKSDLSSEAFESERRAQIKNKVIRIIIIKKETMDTNTEKQEYTITVYTENQVGLLNRIAIIFSRRKINVER